MKLLLLFSLTVTLSFGSAAQKFSDFYTDWDKLYVCSKEGISLRTSPDANATRIMILPYATPVVVKSDSRPRVEFVSTGVPGTWVRVTALEKQGFVFDGFLSRYRPMDPPTSQDGRTLEEITGYLKTLFKVKSQTDKVPDGYIEYEKITFVDGTETEHARYEGGSMFTIRFSKGVITFQETYLMARMAYPEFFTTPCPYKEGNMTCLFEGDENIRLEISTDSAAGRHKIVWGHAD